MISILHLTLVAVSLCTRFCHLIEYVFPILQQIYRNFELRLALSACRAQFLNVVSKETMKTTFIDMRQTLLIEIKFSVTPILK